MTVKASQRSSDNRKTLARASHDGAAAFDWSQRSSRMITSGSTFVPPLQESQIEGFIRFSPSSSITCFCFMPRARMIRRSSRASSRVRLRLWLEPTAFGTVELLSTVMASVSDRVDAQTDVLDRVNKTPTEARQAAFAAMAQTDPKRYGELIGETIDGWIKETLIRMASQQLRWIRKRT